VILQLTIYHGWNAKRFFLLTALRNELFITGLKNVEV
jgi:hypothetical protein